MHLERGFVVCSRSGFFDVQLSDRVVRCRSRGRLKKERQSSDLVVVGDQVAIDVAADGTGMIVEVEPRKTRFSRRQPGPSGKWKEDVLVANVDRVVVVFAFGTPRFSPRMLDRFLVIAEYNDLDALIVANKADLATGDEGNAQREDFEAYRRLGYPIRFTSVVTGEGVDDLADDLRGKMSVLTGPSGVGKSTLINVIEPGLDLRIGEASVANRKGRHTTTAAELHPLSGGGFVADTPGIREIGTYDLPSEELSACFAEFRPWLGRCGFGNCLHRTEPRCEIRDALKRGEISEARYESYLRILEESTESSRRD